MKRDGTSRDHAWSGRLAERGVLLPLLAVMLAGGAALWLAGIDPGPAAGADPYGRQARAPLLAARRALIAHATAYPEAYGPLGAGPGHLVCPDTDTPLGRHPETAPGRGRDRFSGDGPNPPCGNGSLAIGRLPRHLGLTGRRRAFHHESTQRFLYAVASGYVNNPPGRAVQRSPGGASGDVVVAVVVDPGGISPELGTLADALDPRDFLARVRLAVRREGGAAAARSLPHVLVTRADLTDAARRRVAAWFVETATLAARRRGAGEPSTAGADARSHWPTSDCPDGRDADLSRWLGDDDATCDEPVPTIENTPRDRHWFVREDWGRDIELRRHPRCLTSGADLPACRLVVRREGDVSRAPPVTAEGLVSTSISLADRRAARIVVELVPGGERSASAATPVPRVGR